MSRSQTKAQTLNEYLGIFTKTPSSLKEYDTAAYISKELTAFWNPIKQNKQELAIIKGQGEGKTVLLRADIDALELPDCTGKPWRLSVLG